MPFIPDILELGILTFKNTGNSKLGFVEKVDQYFLIKASHTCIDALDYYVPVIPENFIVIIYLSKNVEFVLTWGKDRIVIDRFQVILPFEFISSYHLLIGLLENARMRVNIKRGLSLIRGSFSVYCIF